MRPSVSIITPSYNSSSFILQTLRSVTTQTFNNWEVIIVDDCSSDSSAEVIQQYASQDPRIKFIQLEKNSGASIARNTAIEVATGRFIAFLDSDDLWHPEKLEKQISFMLENEVAFSYTAYEKIDEKGVSFDIVNTPTKISYKQLLKTNVIGCLTAMYDVEKLGKVYMPVNTKREDFATWLAILKKIDYAYGMPEVLARYRVYASQSSAKKTKMAKENWRLYRDLEQLSIFKSAYYFTHYAVRGVLRTKFPTLARALGVLD
ncbi:glycosyltransferase family 2 protein [Denitrificimonas sp. JX-1]|uniref:Glycosyltransferase family 2 protein n=1 Tax=Denitrificimonas halotolerans TaxID=3098930 RepID=A0ABU5GT17_9GAMM|nr:glycosyltransferase family 2 protein [Denitrificimonas sp. JX-1]MDY7218788.1 glycosyltransferase family 2 protein [Denitrificimonas sp. JX-1]